MEQHQAARALTALADPDRRLEGADALARFLGVPTVLLMLRDPVVKVMVPAPGFPQTLRGGPGWREFLRRCMESGSHAAELDCGGEHPQHVEAFVQDGLALLTCGGRPDPAKLLEIEPLLPVLACALRSEMRVALARAEADDARGLASRAQVLAAALDAARQEATRLNAELRDEHRRKDEFLAMLAHELRNPLSPLVHATEIMRRRDAGADAHTRKILEIMRRQTSHLARLVDDLLDISRVTRGKIELRPEEVSLWDVVNNAVEVNRALIEAKGHELALMPPPRALLVHADPVRLTQVVSNLLHNAAKYTPASGRIQVEAGIDGQEAFVRVTDNGIGIAREMLDAVFDLFAQVPTPAEQSLGGLGIGLTLVRSLAEMHGGRVTAHSAGLGKGSSFCLRLPLGQRGRASRASRFRRDDATVLVVTSNAALADELRGALQSSGHRVEAAYSALTAVQLPAHMHFDAVVLDAALSDAELSDLAARLRRLLRSSARIVLAGDRSGAPIVGVDAVLPMPVTAQALEESLSRHLEHEQGESARTR
jgi:signal transduction histidine kinase/CheY-like chemotaxis protein